eukprot:126874_1
MLISASVTAGFLYLSFLLVCLGKWDSAQQHQLQPAGLTPSALFGCDVAISNDRMVIGAYNDELPSKGAAYVYKYNTLNDEYIMEQRIQGSDVQPGYIFGWSVAIYNDVIVVGAPLADLPSPDCGAAYVFRLNTSTNSWYEEQKLLADNPVSPDHFGVSVAIQGDIIVVGAYLNDITPIIADSGAVYIFKFTGTLWNQTQNLTASDPSISASFGKSVSISDTGDVIAVSAWGEDDPGDAGGCYVFKRNPNNDLFFEQQHIRAFDRAASDLFGISVALWQDDLLAIGSYGDDNPVDSGSVYIYQFNSTQWQFTQKLKASDAAASDVFGTSVDIYENVMVVGAHLDDNPVVDGGSVYIFEYNATTFQWDETIQLTASDSAPGDGFGYAVSIFNHTIVVGAVIESGSDLGTAYVFTEIPDTPSPIVPTTAIPTTINSTENEVVGNDTCEDRGLIKHLNWESIHNPIPITNSLPEYNFELEINRLDKFGINIELTLDYIGSSFLNNNSNNTVGTAYVFDFVQFRAGGINMYTDKIEEAGSCSNRLSTSYINKNFSSYWEYSPNPSYPNQLGSTDYLAYGPL